MSEDNAGYCPAYLEPWRVKGTFQGDPALHQDLALPKAAPHLWDADFNTARERGCSSDPCPGLLAVSIR